MKTKDNSEKSLRRGVYPLSANPPTLAHIDIIKRASELVDELHVVIFNNPDKIPLLPPNFAYLSSKKNLKDIDNVLYGSDDGLVSDYCQKNAISLIIRGFRNSFDLEYESFLEKGNQLLFSKLETLYLRSKQQLSHISSSSVRSLLSQKALIHNYTPSNIKEYFEKKNALYLIGLSGSIAVGKTTLGLSIVDALRKKNLIAHYLDLDKIVHLIYENNHYPLLRDNYVKYFGQDILSKESNAIDKNLLSKKLYAMPDSTEGFDFIRRELHSPLLSEIQKYLKERRGFIFIDGTVLIENNMLAMVNHNMILIHCQKQQQLEQLMNRDNLTKEIAEIKIQKANSFENKLALYKEKSDPHGRLWTLENNKKSRENTQILVDELVEHFLS